MAGSPIPTTAAGWFPLVAPELSSAPPATQAAFLGWAAQEVNAGVFGAMAPQATALLAAHLLTEAGYGATGQASIAAMQKAGMLTEQFKIPDLKSGEQPYATTTYGIRYIRLRRIALPGPQALW